MGAAGQALPYEIMEPLLRLLTVVVLVVAGCDRSAAPLGGDDAGGRRVVSLSPVVTQVLIELGLGGEVVAVGDLDPLAARLPGDDVQNGGGAGGAPSGTSGTSGGGAVSVGRAADLDLERLLTLRPTHVLLTSGAAGPPAGLERLAEGRGFTVTELGYPDTVLAVAGVVCGIGQAVGEADAADAMAREMLERLGELATRTADGPRPRALLVFATDPVMASGPGTVLDELLTIAGGVNAAGDLAVSAPTFDEEALAAMAVDVVFLFDPGGPPRRDDDPRLTAFEVMQPVEVHVLTDEAVLIPGPSLAETAEAMARALHAGVERGGATTQAAACWGEGAAPATDSPTPPLAWSRRAFAGEMR